MEGAVGLMRLNARAYHGDGSRNRVTDIIARAPRKRSEGIGRSNGNVVALEM